MRMTNVLTNAMCTCDVGVPGDVSDASGAVSLSLFSRAHFSLSPGLQGHHANQDVSEYR